MHIIIIDQNYYDILISVTDYASLWLHNGFQTNGSIIKIIV